MTHRFLYCCVHALPWKFYLYSVKYLLKIRCLTTGLNCKTFSYFIVIPSHPLPLLLGLFSMLPSLFMIWVFLRSLLRLLVNCFVPSSPILVSLMMDASRSPETSVLEQHGVKSQKKTLFPLCLWLRSSVFLHDFILYLVRRSSAQFISMLILRRSAFGQVQYHGWTIGFPWLLPILF
jgi:hypothetical protein